MFKRSMGAIVLALAVAGFTVLATAAPFRQKETQTTMQSETMMMSNSKSNKSNVKKKSIKKKKTTKITVKSLGGKTRKS